MLIAHENYFSLDANSLAESYLLIAETNRSPSVSRNYFHSSLGGPTISRTRRRSQLPLIDPRGELSAQENFARSFFLSKLVVAIE